MFSAKQYVLPMICSLHIRTRYTEQRDLLYLQLVSDSAPKVCTEGSVRHTGGHRSLHSFCRQHISSMGLNRNARQPAPKAPALKPVDQRGREWQAERLTGARAQRGALTLQAGLGTFTRSSGQESTPRRMSRLRTPTSRRRAFTPRLCVAHREAVAARRTLR